MQFLLDLVGSALFLLVIFERVGHSLATDKSRVTIVSGGSTLQNGIWQVMGSVVYTTKLGIFVQDDNWNSITTLA